MTSLGVLWIVTAALAPMQSPSSVDEIIRLAAASPGEPSLHALIVEHPDDARDALRHLLRQAVLARRDTEPGGTLATAHRVAEEYLRAWDDPFLLRQVVRFTAWSPDQRRETLRADSLRRVGNDVLAREGVPAALSYWRESLRASAALVDSAGMAAALGNIGAGFYMVSSWDSAASYLEQSRVLAEMLGDFRTEGNALGILASVKKDHGELSVADSLYRSALEVRQRTGDTRGSAADFNNIGLIAQERGRLDSAVVAFQAALELNRRYGRLSPAATNLTNLANVASLEGEYDKARDDYEQALLIYRDQDARGDIAFVLRNLGLLELRRGDYEAAVVRLSAAAAIYDQTGPPTDLIAVRRELATARAASGDLSGAMIALQRAERLARATGGDAATIAGIALTRADLAFQFNDYSVAQRDYETAARLFQRAGDSAGQAEAVEGKGLLLLAREEYPRARSALERAARQELAHGDRRAAATTGLLSGYAARESGDTVAARRDVNASLHTLQLVGDAAGEATALGALADLDFSMNRIASAESLYRRGLDRLASTRAAPVAWRLHAGLAWALQKRGALDESAAELRVAADYVEKLTGGLRSENRRTAFLSDKWELYGNLALVDRNRQRIGEAFSVSERMRAREMLSLLAHGRLTGQGAGADTLVKREQDLRRAIAELAARLDSADADAPGLRGSGNESTGFDELRERLARFERQYAALLEGIRDRQPEYGGLVAPAMAEWQDLARHLGADQALLEYLVADSAIIVFVVKPDTIAAIDVHGARHSLAALIQFARGAMIQRVAWRLPLQRLYALLIAPIEEAGLLRGTHQLLIAPHAELHYLPFGALVRSGSPDEFLIQRYSVTYVPSGYAWVRLMERPGSPPDGRILALAPRDRALPGARTEVDAIQRLYGKRATVLTGQAASKNAFRAAAPAYSYIHLATYGRLNNRNPLFSFVQLNREAGGIAGDSRLEVHEVFGLSLHARVVVLSACQTGLGAGMLNDVPAGDDWVGLVRAFLVAGADNVVATLWPIDDRATALLMERFYRELDRGYPVSEAIARAQRMTLRDREHADPFNWAGFVASGAR